MLQQKVLASLEFHKVKEKVMSYTASTLGKEKAQDLIPLTDIESIQHLLEEVAEAQDVIRLKGSAPFGGLTDIRRGVKRAEIGSILSPSELMEIAALLYTTKNMKHFLASMYEDGVEIPRLHTYAESLILLPDVRKEIESCIGDNGEVLDHATPALRTIRTQLRSL
ncbi:endonuclease MutS2, partial [Bacillus altitudinis]|nr:endonuclease MutS2 [Bacillus altitudinis]